MKPRLLTALAAAALSALTLATPAEAAPQDFGLQAAGATLSTTQAGAHPDLTLAFELNQDPESDPNRHGDRYPFAVMRNLTIENPPGFVGDPNVIGLSQQCLVQQLVGERVCPNGSQVGISHIQLYNGGFRFCAPVYMMVPPGGDTVARFGFLAGALPFLINFEVRSESDYGLTAEIFDAPSTAAVVRSDVTLWGVPADPSHDAERGTGGLAEVFGGECDSEPRPPGGRALSFLTNPTRCISGQKFKLSAVSWLRPDLASTISTELPAITGCDRLPFGPDLTVEPTNRVAAAPTGADVTIRLAAPDGADVLEPSQMRDIRVTLPEGMVFNPAAADGLSVCSVAQVHFGERAASECPDAAKVASTEFDVPALPRKMKGAVYLREPQPGNLFRIWIVADDLGAHVKLPGQLKVDPVSGQITEVTLDSPQIPVREVKLLFKSGFRAPLVNPPTCGTHFTHYEFTPWSGTGPVEGDTPMTIDQGCDTGGFDPKLTAGTANPRAGQHSPFVFTLTREDGEQNLAALDIVLPPGLAASFAGIPRCEGAAAVTGACPAASRIGVVRAASGAGPAPLWVPQPGKRRTAVYLAGPYKGAPLSIVAVVPAQAGPFDLGDQVVRSAIHVDSRTAQATIKSDPLPQIIEGIPIDYRTIHVAVDRPGFTLNPTNCSPMAVTTEVTSDRGALTNLSSPFQVGDCASLGFKPRLSLHLKGGTKRGDHPTFRAVLRPRPGDANISRTVVKLPRTAFLDQAHIRTICTRVQFAADACPPGAVYGRVRAFSPLLDEPLEGPAILRSSDNLLPDLVFDLKGLVEIEAAGRIDSVRGGIRATFAGIPDAPLSKVVVEMQGGEKGLIVNSRNLCAKPSRANVKLNSHSGRRRSYRPKVRPSCGEKHRGHTHRRSQHTSPRMRAQ